jgi:hypothetical protein
VCRYGTVSAFYGAGIKFWRVRKSRENGITSSVKVVILGIVKLLPGISRSSEPFCGIQAEVLFGNAE